MVAASRPGSRCCIATPAAAADSWIVSTQARGAEAERECEYWREVLGDDYGCESRVSDDEVEGLDLGTLADDEGGGESEAESECDPKRYGQRSTRFARPGVGAGGITVEIELL